MYLHDLETNGTCTQATLHLLRRVCPSGEDANSQSQPFALCFKWVMGNVNRSEKTPERTSVPQH